VELLHLLKISLPSGFLQAAQACLFQLVAGRMASFTALFTGGVKICRFAITSADGGFLRMLVAGAWLRTQHEARFTYVRS
jgi:hypothetical protein